MAALSVAHVIAVDLEFRRFVELKNASLTIFDDHCFIYDDHADIDCCLVLRSGVVVCIDDGDVVDFNQDRFK